MLSAGPDLAGPEAAAPGNPPLGDQGQAHGRRRRRACRGGPRGRRAPRAPATCLTTQQPRPDGSHSPGAPVHRGRCETAPGSAARDSPRRDAARAPAVPGAERRPRALAAGVGLRGAGQRGGCPQAAPAGIAPQEGLPPSRAPSAVSGPERLPAPGGTQPQEWEEKEIARGLITAVNRLVKCSNGLNSTDVLRTHGQHPRHASIRTKVKTG